MLLAQINIDVHLLAALAAAAASSTSSPSSAYYSFYSSSHYSAASSPGGTDLEGMLSSRQGFVRLVCEGPWVLVETKFIPTS